MAAAWMILVTLAALAQPQVSALSFDAANAKNRPVTKVVNLLKEMLKQLEKEGEEDEAVYNKLACWCETNNKEKTKAVKVAEGRIADLTVKIEENTAKSARLTTEIKHLESEVAKNQEALDQATAIRQSQLAEFNAEEKDLLESIAALKQAVTVLSKHHSDSFLQMPQKQLSQVRATVAALMEKHSVLLNGALSSDERRAAKSFLQKSNDYFDAEPTFRQSYAPQSGEIYGILRQMKESFEGSLTESQNEERANQASYEQLKAAKENEINAGQEQIDTKTAELADTDEKLAHAKEDIVDTRASLSADEAFLLKLKEKCQMSDQEWEERQKTRAREMQAVSKALSVLSADDAHDLFSRTFNPALLQESSRSESAQRTEASKLLQRVADKQKNPRLSALAYKVRLDAFTRVKAGINEMIEQLLKEKQDEIKHKDFCVEEFHNNEVQTTRKDREKQDAVAKIEDLEFAINKLSEELDVLKSEIAEMQLQLQRAGENRAKANEEFQATVSDQRETQKLLQAALSVLADFYGKKDEQIALLQQPAGFDEYKHNAASGGVMDLLKQIIADAKSMEDEAVRAETESQQAYEDFVRDTNAAIAAKSKEILNKSESRAKAEADLVETKEHKEAVLLELETLANSKAQLKQSCDFILENFEIRQSARDEEVNALKQALAILSGAKFDSFLQHS